MSLKKHLLLFLLKFAVVYIILLLPVFRDRYADFFNATGNKWFRTLGEKGITLFNPRENGQNENIISTIILVNRDQLGEPDANGRRVLTGGVKVEVSNWYTYLIVAYFAALVIATPISRKRKLFSLVGGLLLIYFYFVFMIWVGLLYEFNNNPQLGVLQLQGIEKELINLLRPLVIINPGTAAYVALFIYILVVFRKGDWEKLKAALPSFK